jgi:hypothetical protein
MLVGTFDAVGNPVELRAPRSIAAVLADALADLVTDGTPASRIEVRRTLRRRWSVRADGAEVSFAGPVDLAVYETIGQLSDLAARAAAVTDIALHASAVDIAGTALALAGPSGAGKSTLAAALCLAGHRYLADEVTAVAVDDLAVRPFHRPIGLRRDGAAALGVDTGHGPYEFTYPLRVGGRATLSDGAPLGALVLLRRGDDVGSTPVDPAGALFQLANLTLGSTGHERIMFRRLERLVRAVPVHEVVSNDLPTAVQLVEDVAAAHRS